MGIFSLRVGGLSHNDILCLADILETNFKYYCEHASAFEQDYLKEIKTVIGLGFTAVLVDGSLISMYQSRMNTFLELSDIRKHELSLPYLSMQLAEMIDLALWMFSCTGLPGYYKDFQASMKKILTHINLQLAGKSGEAKRLLNVMKVSSTF